MIKGRGRLDVVAVDISGRHAVKGRYYMICAAVAARINARHLEQVYLVRQYPRVTQSLDLGEVSDLISAATVGLDGIILAERGDLYNIERWRVQSLLGRQFKYPESLGERLAVELAHHVSLAGRRLIEDGGREDGWSQEGTCIDAGEQDSMAGCPREGCHEG